jgi:hypothetical protein
MSLFKKIFGSGTSSPPADDPLSILKPGGTTPAQDKRAHDRLHIFSRSNSWLDIGPKLQLYNLSYGGVACEETKDSTHLGAGQTLAGKLHICGRTVPVDLTVIYSRNGIQAFRFNHGSSDTLIALRDIIESMQAGASLRPISKDNLKDEYKTTHWICLGGDRGTFLRIKSKDGKRLDEALLSFRIDSARAAEVIWKGPVASTSFTTGEEHAGKIGSVAQTTTAPDQLTLERARFLLAAMDPKPVAWTGVMDELMNALKTKGPN